MDNKVAQTLARAAIALGATQRALQLPQRRRLRGHWDEGRGEIDDALAVVNAMRRAGEPLLLAGFSFGAYVASRGRGAAAR